MLNTPFPPWPSFSKEESKVSSQILLSNKVNYWTGQEGRLFEEEFSKFCGVKYSIALANGSVALDIVLLALGVSKGDEVIVTSRTFIASASCIVNLGAKPIFVDISRDSQNITAKNIESAITKKTKAVICVHLAGWPCDMDEIMKLSEKYDFFVIEDCAQAHGAFYKGKSVGSIGHIGCWSFCQDKIITTAGEGGMVTTNDRALWEKIWSYKDHGKSMRAIKSSAHKKGFRWVHHSFGTNLRLTEIQSAIGRIQLKRLKEMNIQRNKNLFKIWEKAKKIKGLRVPEFKCESCNCSSENRCIHGAYKCYVFIEPKLLRPSWTRDRIIDNIQKKGVPCYPGSCSEVYLEKAFKKSNLAPFKRLENARELGETSLMFLVHPNLRKRDILLTCKVLEDTMTQAVIG
jgi:dTDP-4-amino-4,6-dideoxygalactose transaminase